MTPPSYDSLLIVSFGGPEGPDDVLPFLENVLRGRNVPRERMLEVAEHYQHFGGVSPINAQNRALIAALEGELHAHGPELPIYWGNRNWRPLLADTLRQMAADGRRRALAFVTAATSSYSSCRQYLDNIAAAQAEVGSTAPAVDKLRAFFNHPGYIAALVDRVTTALDQLPESQRRDAVLVFTAHSIPQSMAQTSRYQQQLEEASRLVVAGLSTSLARSASEGISAHASNNLGLIDNRWRLVFQSRSGPPSQPWLEPDICDYLRQLKAAGVQSVVVVPVGFISDHMEVLYDLDTEAAAVAEELGLNFVRAGTAGTHPRFVAMIRELIVERMDPRQPRLALGELGPSHDVCPADCCPRPQR
ncbi:MAG: ferrochelatase [Planctomycetaceae bacterium]|nr:ferrochelatase [Planctomycetaceae bacterium]